LDAESTAAWRLDWTMQKEALESDAPSHKSIPEPPRYLIVTGVAPKHD